jgi:hypothetical protein
MAAIVRRRSWGGVLPLGLHDLHNLYEEIKRSDKQFLNSSVSPRGETEEHEYAETIKNKYKNLGLIPESFFKNSLLSQVLGVVSSAFKEIARGIMQLISDHMNSILQELRMPPGTTVVVQAEFSWRPESITLGVERTT